MRKKYTVLEYGRGRTAPTVTECTASSGQEAARMVTSRETLEVRVFEGLGRLFTVEFLVKEKS